MILSAHMLHAMICTFTGVDGARIYAKLVKPKKIEGKAPAIIKFHGYGWYSGDWTELLHYAAEGFIVAAMDSRGQGGKSRDAGDRGINTMKGQIIRGIDDGADRLLFRSIFLDTAQISYLVMGMDDVDEAVWAVWCISRGRTHNGVCIISS